MLIIHSLIDGNVYSKKGALFALKHVIVLLAKNIREVTLSTIHKSIDYSYIFVNCIHHCVYMWIFIYKYLQIIILMRSVSPELLFSI
jgi:hypothetical protein